MYYPLTIKSLARAIIKKTGMTCPIDIETLIEKLGGIVIYGNNLPKEAQGKIEKLKNEFKITIREKQNYLLAQELGHLILHMGFLANEEVWDKTEYYVDSVYHRFDYSVEDFEAKTFADEILVPQTDLKEKFENDVMKQLMAYYGVSEKVIQRKLRSLL